MRRAALKGAGLFVFGRVPCGVHAYREITRNWMGTQATHVDKLARVWPSYAEVWNPLCPAGLEGMRIWVHEAGWTPFPGFANFLLTGNAGVLTNTEGRILDKYLARAVNGALTCRFPVAFAPESRRRHLEALRWEEHAGQVLLDLGGCAVACRRGGPVELESESVDLCHSGGALEHYPPQMLRSFLGECFRILKPGGIASHVFDHRDHLFHADGRIPFLAHLAWHPWAYSVAFGHGLAYHNRLLPAEVARLVVEAGFDLLRVRRMVLPDGHYVEGSEALAGKPGIARASLHRQFSTASDEDLRTAAAHYLCRKPFR